ncbi:hypothetical protein SAMN04487902_105128 [Prevotella sp. ne3005]|uniref:hypothetical protein n=1 Tax=Prevotella sp. ne3005 TaxID=1761887 RepID=UPI0008C0F9E8|nr:hypothetical protein [Prevotella sp. ne3005]SEM94885.1 hypothetical protein SAMN04487902_105128 [Prevotella sp. ne3005]
MTDFDTIWRTQDEIRTVVNAVLGALGFAALTEGTQECIWNLSYNDRRMAIELELAKYLEEEEVNMLINQFPVTADYDGVGSKGTKFVFYV